MGRGSRAELANADRSSALVSSVPNDARGSAAARPRGVALPEAGGRRRPLLPLQEQRSAGPFPDGRERPGSVGRGRRGGAIPRGPRGARVQGRTSPQGATDPGCRSVLRSRCRDRPTRAGARASTTRVRRRHDEELRARHRGCLHRLRATRASAPGPFTRVRVPALHAADGRQALHPRRDAHAPGTDELVGAARADLADRPRGPGSRAGARPDGPAVHRAGAVRSMCGRRAAGVRRVVPLAHGGASAPSPRGAQETAAVHGRVVAGPPQGDLGPAPAPSRTAREEARGRRCADRGRRRRRRG